MSTPPLVLFEDEHLLVINKPPDINTHAPSPHASEGIYDWLRNRDTRWRTLAIHQRLDRDTSGVLIFGKTRTANQSLARQFESREVDKVYQLLTNRDPGRLPRTVASHITKAAGGTFRSTQGANAKPAKTDFALIEKRNEFWLIEARPLTGRTHQIRIHASDAGFPILGDTTYGGSPFGRLCLHAHMLQLQHPLSGELLQFVAPVEFNHDPHIWLRQALWPEPETDAWRLIHGASDGHPDWYVDRLGGYLLSQSEHDLNDGQLTQLQSWSATLCLRGVYHKTLNRQVRQSTPDNVSPQPVLGASAPPRFEIRENGLRFSISFDAGYSVGLFLDQRDNRRRLLTGHVFPGADAVRLNGQRVLNTFAYTCGFSVCAAMGGAMVTSLDLSKKYLEWGRDNLRLNQLDPEQHDFIYGDCFNWMKRLTRKGRVFDVILLDPPTFSKSKESGIFRADKDYDQLIESTLQLLAPGGLLFASTNCTTLAPETFLATIRDTITRFGRGIENEFYAPQPPDFPTSTDETGYLKTVWLKVM